MASRMQHIQIDELVLKTWSYFKMLYLTVNTNDKKSLKHCFYIKATDWIAKRYFLRVFLAARYPGFNSLLNASSNCDK